MIELRYWNIPNKTPRLSTISGDIQTAIITINHKISIFRMNPPRMMIGVNTVTYAISRHELGEVFSTIFRNVNVCKNGIQSIFIFRINTNIRIVEWSVTDVIFIVYLFPLLSSIGRFVKGIFFRFNQSVNNVWFVFSNG